MNYLLKLNPFLTKKMRKEPGDMIHYRDVIMVHHPDYTYQNFLNGGEPFPTVPMDWQKKRDVEFLARNKGLDNQSSLSNFAFETFFILEFFLFGVRTQGSRSEKNGYGYG